MGNGAARGLSRGAVVVARGRATAGGGSQFATEAATGRGATVAGSPSET